MKLCDTCHRHVRASEGACPFCGRSLRTAPAVRLGAVVLLGVLETACSGRPVEETAGDTTAPSSTAGGDASGSPTSSSSTTSTATTSTGDPQASSTGELSSTGDIDTSDTGCSFYGGCPADFANPIECSTFAQDCPEGQKCSSKQIGDEFFDATECVPIARDPDQPGQPCTVEGSPSSGLDSCNVGSMCWHVDEQTLAGTCVNQCAGPPDDPACPATTTCVRFNEALHLCLPICDPLAPACAPDEVCAPNFLDDGQLFACRADDSGDGGAEFEPCEFFTACDLGLACLESTLAMECDPQTVGCCLSYCDLNAPTCTGAGAECTPWFEEGQAPADLANLGVCVLPP